MSKQVKKNKAIRDGIFFFEKYLKFFLQSFTKNYKFSAKFWIKFIEKWNVIVVKFYYTYIRKRNVKCKNSAILL